MAGKNLLVFVALTIVSSVLVLPTARGNSEGDALSALRRSLSDPDNVLQSWDPNLVNPCYETAAKFACRVQPSIEEKGFQDCNTIIFVYARKYLSVFTFQLLLNIHCMVLGMGNGDLGNSNLSGHLVPELGKLEHLQYLELYKNNIQGSIPTELGNLKSLISLDLYNNNISGKIPPSLGNLKSLVFLRLNDNQLNGPIPRALSSISTLKVVDVSNNNLCGTIPTTGPFEHIPLNNFENNPRLEGPELQGLASYDTNCS
ncbi:hypothetical protein BUALT_Bualt12G0046000 [Buddleja alternifolia]|uniref:Leucine-rich repeat protein n=1 Tax=Buddleja alternifolia TaxID=168488 RepID=A0AAV6WVW8_9LAMI|nr:hypothetical protein BUALT_Bualt12G0046000 [Buddleja alternifolia]